MKKKDDRLGSDPFENVLTHLSDSRKKKDNDVNSANADDSNNSKNKSDDNARNINNVSDENKNNVRNNFRNNVGNKINVTDIDNSNDDDNSKITSNVKSNLNAIVGDVDNVENVSTDDNNFINISKKQKKTDGYVRVSTYLLPDQVKAIEELQKKTGRDKGELYRMAVNILIERARVE